MVARARQQRKRADVFGDIYTVHAYPWSLKRKWFNPVATSRQSAHEGSGKAPTSLSSSREALLRTFPLSLYHPAQATAFRICGSPGHYVVYVTSVAQRPRHRASDRCQPGRDKSRRSGMMQDTAQRRVGFFVSPPQHSQSEAGPFVLTQSRSENLGSRRVEREGCDVGLEAGYHAECV